MNQDKMEELLEERLIFSEEEQKEMNRKVRKGILHTVYLRVLAVIAVLSMLVCLFIGGSCFFKDRASFHLGDLEMVYNEAELAEAGLDSGYENAKYYVNSYYSIFHPGTLISWKQGKDEKLDYGYYKLDGVPIDIFRTNIEDFLLSYLTGTSGDGFVSVKDGILNNQDDQEVLRRDTYFRRFWEEELRFKFDLKSNVNKEIETLPDSAEISLDIRLTESMDLSELLKLQIRMPESRIIYAVTDLVTLQSGTPEEKQYVLGFSLVKGLTETDALLLMSDAESKNNLSVYNRLSSYPLFWDDYYIMTLEKLFSRKQSVTYDEWLKKNYYNDLGLLVNNGLLDGNVQEKEAAESVLKNAEENDLTVKGYLIICTKDDALHLLSDSMISSAHIDDVKLTRFSD